MSAPLPPNSDSNLTRENATDKEEFLRKVVSKPNQQLIILTILALGGLIIFNRGMMFLLSYFKVNPTNLDLPTLLSVAGTIVISLRWLVERFRKLILVVINLTERVQKLESKLDSEKIYADALENRLSELEKKADYQELRIDHNDGRLTLVERSRYPGGR